MNLKDLIAVSGMPGIYRMAANRDNGMIIEDLDSGKRRFASTRKYQFTPLESISIYTIDEDEAAELKTIFRNMLSQITENPPVSLSSQPDELRAYFTDILPVHDPDRVHIRDIKKMIKWFVFLNERDLLSLDTSDEEE